MPVIPDGSGFSYTDLESGALAGSSVRVFLPEGPTIASAASIALTHASHVISGVATINTITGIAIGEVRLLISQDGFSVGASGNIISPLTQIPANSFVLIFNDGTSIRFEGSTVSLGAIPGAVDYTTQVSGKPATFAPSAHAHPESDVTGLVADLAAKAATVHTHAEADVTGLVTDLAGKAATVHTHAEADITNLVTDLAAKQATSAKDAANGYPGLSAASKIAGTQITYGTIASTACQGNDSRLADARTPTAHAATHAAGGGDAITITEAQVTNLATDLTARELTANKNAAAGYPGLTAGKIAGTQITYGTLVSTACQGNDSRLSDARTPTAHAASHGSAGGDALLNALLEAIKALATNGMMVKTGASTCVTRTITASTGVTVTNGDGVAGNPTIAIGQAIATTDIPQFARLGVGQAADATAALAVTGQVFNTQETVTFSATPTFNWNLGNRKKITLTANITGITFSNPEPGAMYSILFIQDATGSRTVTGWPTIKWFGGSAPTLTTTASKADLVTVYYDGTSYYGGVSQNG